MVKAIELVFGFDAEVWAITWLSLKISGGATLNLAFARCSFGHRPGSDSLSRPFRHRRAGEHRHGASARSRGTLCVAVSLAQRSLGFSGADLFADGDGESPKSSSRFPL